MTSTKPYFVAILLFIFSKLNAQVVPAEINTTAFPGLALTSEIGWAGGYGYYIGEVRKSVGLARVDNSFKVVTFNDLGVRSLDDNQPRGILLGSKLYVLYFKNEKDGKRNIYHEFAMSMDCNTLKPIGSAIDIFKASSTDEDLSKETVNGHSWPYEMTISKNRKYFMSYRIAVSGSERSLKVGIFDSSFAKISDGKISLGEHGLNMDQIEVDNQGTGFISGNFFGDKKYSQPQYSMLSEQYWDLFVIDGKSEPKKIELTPGDTLFSFLRGICDKKGELIVYGGYSQRTFRCSKGLYCRIYDKDVSKIYNATFQFDATFVNDSVYNPRLMSGEKSDELRFYNIVGACYDEAQNALVIVGNFLDAGDTYSSNKSVDILLSRISLSERKVLYKRIRRYAFVVKPKQYSDLFFYAVNGSLHVLCNTEIYSPAGDTSPVKVIKNEYYDTDKHFAFPDRRVYCDYVFNLNDFSCTPKILWQTTDRTVYLTPEFVDSDKLYIEFSWTCDSKGHPWKRVPSSYNTTLTSLY